MTRLAAISDLHLGAPAGYLTLQSVRDRLVKSLKQDGSELSCLFLIGDIMDLTVGYYPEPWLAAKEFFKVLDQVDVDIKRIIYIPGNHDHHVWTLLAEHEQLLKTLPELKRDRWKSPQNLLAGSCYGYHTPLHELFPQRLQERVAFSYPFHWFSHQESHRRFVFHHGHYFDPSITPLRTGAHRYEDLRKFEAMNLPYIEALFYFFSWDPVVQDAELDCYEKLTRFNLSKPGSALQAARSWLSRRGNGPPSRSQERVDMVMDATSLRKTNLEEKDVWVFGHTHQRGRWPLDKAESVVIFDVGGWVLNHDPRSEQNGAWSRPAVFHWKDGDEPRLDDLDLTEEERDRLATRFRRFRDTGQNE